MCRNLYIRKLLQIFLLSGSLPDWELSCLLFPPFVLKCNVLGLVLVLVRVRGSNGSAGTPGGIAIHQDKHKAPSHLRIRPLSLQNAGDASVPMGVITLFDWKNSSGRRQTFPDSVVKNHQGDGS